MKQPKLLLPIIGLFVIYLVGNLYGADGRTKRTASIMTTQIQNDIADFHKLPSPNEEINISDYETLLMQDHTYNLTSRVNADGHAEIIIRNSNVTLSPSEGISILLKGESRILVFNSTISFARLVYGDCQIVLEDEAEANLTESTAVGWGYVTGRGASAIYVGRSSLGSGVTGIHSPGVATHGTSRVNVEGSAVDGVYVWENSTASIDGSDVGTVRTIWTGEGKTAINITNSHVQTIETSALFKQSAGMQTINVRNSAIESALYVHDNSIAWVEKSELAMVKATGNATVWLLESSVAQLSLEDNARVLFAWYLPLFGLLGVPYSLVPVLQAGSILVMIAGIATISYAVYRKKKTKKNS